MQLKSLFEYDAASTHDTQPFQAVTLTSSNYFQTCNVQNEKVVFAGMFATILSCSVRRMCWFCWSGCAVANVGAFREASFSPRLRFNTSSDRLNLCLLYCEEILEFTCTFVQTLCHIVSINLPWYPHPGGGVFFAVVVCFCHSQKCGSQGSCFNSSFRFMVTGV